MLDPVEHKNVTVITSRGEKFGEKTNIVPVIADELRSLVTEYSVCFLKDPNTGRFGLYALTGLEPGTNLYLKNDQWQASYLPLHVRRQPFLMGITGNENEKPTRDNTVVTIQLEHKRVTEEGGERLFDEQGNATEYLKSITAILGRLLQGLPKTDAFVDALIEHSLIEQLQLKVTMSDGNQKNLQGFYGINEEKLAALRGQTLEDFFSKGYIQACHMLITSIGHIQKLVHWENNR